MGLCCARARARACDRTEFVVVAPVTVGDMDQPDHHGQQHDMYIRYGTAYVLRRLRVVHSDLCIHGSVHAPTSRVRDYSRMPSVLAQVHLSRAE